jgi:hypothetical protein
MSVEAAGGQGPPRGSVFSLGWLMAQLFGPLQHRRSRDTSEHLPTVSELDEEQQMQLAFAQLADFLRPYPSLSGAGVKTAWDSPGHEGFTAAVKALHLQILQQLINDHPQLTAYQLGRALSDTCWLPSNELGAAFFLREFSRHRLATLQMWLAEASGVLPPLSAATVSRSLQNWQDWADASAPEIRARWETAHWSVVAALRTQAAAWHGLLVGAADTTGQTSVDAWVHAGQSVLRTIRLLMLAIFRRFWPVVAVIAAATGGLLYLAIASSSGTAKVWTSIATVAAALGVSGGSLRAAARKAAGGIEDNIRYAASLDARAWSATWLPTLQEGPMQRYRLASRGVAAPQARRGLEAAAHPEPPAHQPPAQQPPAPG